MKCPECEGSMARFEICDWPVGYRPKQGERAARVTAVIFHCRQCGHQIEYSRD